MTLHTVMTLDVNMLPNMWGTVLPQTVPASWPACLSPGSRNIDGTCHTSPRCCCLWGESPQQTPTRWSTEPKHVEKKEKKEWSSRETLNTEPTEAITPKHKHKEITQYMCRYLNFSQSVLFLPVPHREDVVVGVVDDTKCVSSVLTLKMFWK